MKKISLILAALMLLMAIPFSVGASATYIIANDDIYLPNSTPTVDGTIGNDEGWSRTAYLNVDTAGYYWAHQAMTSSVELYFAYSEDGLYYAADITEDDYVEALDQNGNPAVYAGNTFIPSTGLDDINPDRETLPGDDQTTGSTGPLTGTYSYGYNGDVFTLMLDPLGSMIEEGFTQNTDYSPWYNVGLFDDGTAKMYRGKVNDGDITEEDGVEVAAETTDDGWRLEAFIPWEIIIQDIDDITLGSVQLTADELIEDGATFRAAAMYMDRFYDTEATANETWGRYVTVCEVTDDGRPGYLTSGIDIASFGLNLVIGEEPNPFTDVPEDSWYTVPALWCNSKGYMNGTSATTFAPTTPVTRAMIVQILAKIDGVNLAAVNAANPFTDVPADAWYTNAVLWAASNGITKGMSDTTFEPNTQLTREQLATFFFAYANYKNLDTTGSADLSAFADQGSISGWALTAVKWAVAERLISGTSTTTISPKTVATRAQVAVIVKAFAE